MLTNLKYNYRKSIDADNLHDSPQQINCEHNCRPKVGTTTANYFLNWDKKSPENGLPRSSTARWLEDEKSLKIGQEEKENMWILKIVKFQIQEKWLQI